MMRQRTLQRPRVDAGFTLVELMVSMVVLGFAITAALSISYTLLGGFADNKRVLGVERSARGAIDAIGNALRGAAPGVTTGAVEDLADCSGEIDAITVDNGAGTDGSDILTVMHSNGGALGFLQTAVDNASTELVVNATDPDFRDTLYFQIGDYVVVTNGDNGHLFKVQALTQWPMPGTEDDDWILKVEDNDGTGAKAVGALCGGATTAPLSTASNYAVGSIVVRARRSRFSICEVGNTPYLVLNDLNGDCDASDTDYEPIAEGVEDLQVSVGIDGDDSGMIDVGSNPWIDTSGDELFFNDPADLAPTGLSTSSPRWTGLRITVVARSTDEAQSGTVSTPPTVEDHDMSSASADAFRRRSMSTILELRNIAQ